MNDVTRMKKVTGERSGTVMKRTRSNAFERVRFITVPLLSPVTFFILVTSFIGAMQGFDQFYVMTRGGPAFATTTIVMYIFLNGFSYFKMGYAATLAALLFIAILALTIFQWRVAQRRVFGFSA